MPQIELKGDATDLGWLLHVMLFPNDQQLRDSAYALRTLEERIDGLDDSALLTVDAGTLRIFLDGHSRKEMRKLQDEAFRRSIYSGYILAFIYLMDLFPDVHPKFAAPSIKKAIHACRQFAISPLGTYGDDAKMAYSAATIRDCWVEFKPVAHLWAAFVLNQAYSFIDHKLPESQDELTKFLSVAARLYQFGSNFIPKGTTLPVPILSEEDAWLVPLSIVPSGHVIHQAPTRLAEYMDSYKHGD